MAKKIKKTVQPKAPRRNALTVMLNDAEYKAICDYCKEFKVVNRSKWVRETLMIEVIQALEATSPMLFSEEELR